MKRVALVTGGNRGLGRETARQLARRGFHVILTSRDEEAGRAVARELEKEGLSVEHRPLDVANHESVAKLAESLRRDGTKLHVLVNNAGISMQGFDTEVARKTLEINFFGAMRVTDALMPTVEDGGNIVMVSSGLGELSGVGPPLRERFAGPSLTREALVELAQSFVRDVKEGRHTQAGWPSSGYRVSKISLNALARVLARDLRARKIRVNAVCPGWVRTDMGGPSASRSVEEGAASIVWAALLEDDTTGGFFRDGKPVPW